MATVKYESYAIGDRDDLITEDRRFNLSSLREWGEYVLRINEARAELTVVMEENGLVVLRRFNETTSTNIHKFIDFQFRTENNNLVTLRFQVWDLHLIGFRVGAVGQVWYERRSRNKKHSILGSTFLPFSFKKNYHIIRPKSFDKIHVGRLALSDALDTLAAYPNNNNNRVWLAYKTSSINIAESLKFLSVCIAVYESKNTRGNILEPVDYTFINNWEHVSHYLLKNETDEFIRDRLGVSDASHHVQVLKRD